MCRIALLCLGFIASMTVALADEPLATATEAAWQRALQSKESAGRVAQAAAERKVASAWWADTPAIELSHRSGDWGNVSGLRESEVALAWPFWLPGQRAAHREAAAAGVELAGLAEEEARLAVAAEVRELAWRFAGLVAEEQGASRQAEYLAALTEDVERRVTARELARADALAARAEWLNVQAAALQARQALESARSEWTLLTGLTEIAGMDELGEDPPPADAGRMIDEHPSVRLAAVTLAQSRALLRAERRTPIDTPEFRVLYREEVEMEGLPTDRSVGIGVSVPLGGARKAPRSAAARSAAELAELAAERTREAQRAAVATSRSELVTAERRLQAAETRATLLRERVQLLERSFRAGESSVSDILRERGALADAETALARDQASLGLARSRLRQVLGLMP